MARSDPNTMTAELPLAASRSRHRVMMVSDFFYPNFGGVENHIYKLSQCLMAQGHQVVVVTHAYGDCAGVRYMPHGLKVYYLPRLPFYQQSTLPTLFGAVRALRAIALRERITLVHGHQAFSTLALEACLSMRGMGYKVVFTDHSLFGFADAASIATNKLLKCCLADVHHVVCVSHTSKENTVLRACMPPSSVSVIPNAVDASDFTPDPNQVWPRDPSRDEVVLVCLSRLVYRKGLDLLGLALPHLCARHPNVRVVIGGDGPKRALLRKVIADHGLEQRVEMCGPVRHEDARDFLVRGHVFVNCSLTEAFCIALVEAASAGLVCVSTAVGGVPEVLPPDILHLASPSAEGLLHAIEAAITTSLPGHQPLAQHERVARMYNWRDVATRTAAVYDTVSASSRDDSMAARLCRYARCGRWAGGFFCAVAVLMALYLRLLHWLQPAEAIRPADEPSEAAPAQQQQQGEGVRVQGAPRGTAAAAAAAVAARARRRHT